jgi:uncharacterized membrane protein YagU involved in acid resistance
MKLRWVIVGGTLAATFDILFAFAFYGGRGVPPLRILQSIASGLLGKASYAGGATTAALGLVLHFLIAIAAAFVFYVASRRWAWLVEHAILAGLIFGVCVYAVMNFVVVPLSAFPHPTSFPPVVLVAGLLAHMFLVGLPISLCVRQQHRDLAVPSMG